MVFCEFLTKFRLDSDEQVKCSPSSITESNLAKGLANGTPIGAFMTSDEIAEKYTRPGASTLGGNPVSSVAALATLQVIETEQLPARAREMGKRLKDGLLRLQQKYPVIGDVRGLGLMLGVELVNSNGAPAPEITDLVIEECKNRGILVGKNGLNRNVLAFQPPLVITAEDIDNLLNVLDIVLAQTY